MSNPPLVDDFSNGRGLSSIPNLSLDLLSQLFHFEKIILSQILSNTSAILRAKVEKTFILTFNMIATLDKSKNNLKITLWRSQREHSTDCVVFQCKSHVFLLEILTFRSLTLARQQSFARLTDCRTLDTPIHVCCKVCPAATVRNVIVGLFRNVQLFLNIVAGKRLIIVTVVDHQNIIRTEFAPPMKFLRFVYVKWLHTVVALLASIANWQTTTLFWYTNKELINHSLDILSTARRGNLRTLDIDGFPAVERIETCVVLNRIVETAA